MFEKILYPTDFSDASKKALDYIKEFKACGTKEVVVLHLYLSHMTTSGKRPTSPGTTESWISNK
jgi:hypothetical protein